MFSLSHRGRKKIPHCSGSPCGTMCFMELKYSGGVVLRSLGLFSSYITHKEFSHVDEKLAISFLSMCFQTWLTHLFLNNFTVFKQISRLCKNQKILG
jgi:hypothetical protein